MGRIAKRIAFGLAFLWEWFLLLLVVTLMLGPVGLGGYLGWTHALDFWRTVGALVVVLLLLSVSSFFKGALSNFPAARGFWKTFITPMASGLFMGGIAMLLLWLVRWVIEPLM